MTADPMQRAREAAERVAATIHKINGHWWNRRKRPEAPDLRLILDALLTREDEVRGEERERCARIAEEMFADHGWNGSSSTAGRTIAAAIRADREG